MEKLKSEKVKMQEVIDKIRELHAAFKEKPTEGTLADLFAVLGPNLPAILEAAEKPKKKQKPSKVS